VSRVVSGWGAYLGPDAASGTQAEPLTVDGYLDRLLKYTPVESIVCYILGDRLVRALLGSTLQLSLWLMYSFLVIATLVYWKWLLHAAIQQAAICTTLFVVWGYALGGPWATMSWYTPLLGAVVLAVAVLLSGFVRPR
jgi:hypothetical protein